MEKENSCLDELKFVLELRHFEEFLLDLDNNPFFFYDDDFSPILSPLSHTLSLPRLSLSPFRLQENGGFRESCGEVTSTR